MKSIKLLIILCVSLVLILLTNNTLAKYRDKIDGTTKIKIASWDIKVNNESISNQNALKADIIPVLEENEYVAPGVIAPGVSGYYDILIDASNCDVSFSYNIKTSTNNSSVADLIITGYSINPDINKEIIPINDNITGNVLYNENEVLIRIYIKWIDDGVMDNEADTMAAINQNDATIENNIIFSQIK